MQLHRNDWYVQHARRLLQERGPDAAVHAGLKRLLAGQTDDTRRLRAIWALHVTGGLTEADLVALLADPSEYVRGWAITLLVEAGRPSDTALRRFVTLARDDASALVRLQLASALQRVPVEQRWDVVTALAGRAADAADANQTLMVWYAAEPLVARDMPRALDLAADAALSRLFAFTVQRIADVGTPPALLVLSDRLGRTTDTEHQRALLSGITQIVNKPAVDGSVAPWAPPPGRTHHVQIAPRRRRLRLPGRAGDVRARAGAAGAGLQADPAARSVLERGRQRRRPEQRRRRRRHRRAVVVGRTGLHHAPRVLPGPDHLPAHGRPDARHRARFRRRARHREHLLGQLLRLPLRLQRRPLDRPPGRRASPARRRPGTRTRRAARRTGGGTSSSSRPTTSRRPSRI